MRSDTTKQWILDTLRRAGLVACLVVGGVHAVGAGCVPDFRSASELDETNQVLAVRVTPPEVNPGGTVTLDALVHWPEGAPMLYWLVCIPDVGDTFMSCLSGRLDSTMDTPFCGVDPADRLCLAGVGDSVDYTVPESIFPDDGEDHTFFVNMLAAGADIETCAEVMMGGAPTSDCLLSLKRVVVSYRDPAELNVNPELAHFVFDGSALDPAAVATVDSTAENIDDLRLEISVTAEATSIDEVYPPGGDPSPFDLVVSFFTTCGQISAEKVFLSCAPSEPTGEPRCEPAGVFWRPETTGPCTLYAVLRDGNGGLGWLTQQLEIR
jgi:hypothetical protein